MAIKRFTHSTLILRTYEYNTVSNLTYVATLVQHADKVVKIVKVMSQGIQPHQTCTVFTSGVHFNTKPLPLGNPSVHPVRTKTLVITTFVSFILISSGLLCISLV